MTAESFHAWLLHKQPSGDTSVRAIFFTREQGIIRSLCKGGRTPKKQAILQPFTPLWLAIDQRNDYSFARHIESASAALPLKGNTLFAALYMNELLYYTLRPQDAYPELFDSYVDTMHKLVSAADKYAIEICLRQFEWILLVNNGYSVSFTQEARSFEPIQAELFYQFNANEGFVPHREGIKGEVILKLSQGILADEHSLKIAKFIMRQAIHSLLNGRELKARTLFSLKSH